MLFVKKITLSICGLLLLSTVAGPVMAAKSGLVINKPKDDSAMCCIADECLPCSWFTDAMKRPIWPLHPFQARERLIPLRMTPH